MGVSGGFGGGGGGGSRVFGDEGSLGFQEGGRLICFGGLGILGPSASGFIGGWALVRVLVCYCFGTSNYYSHGCSCDDGCDIEHYSLVFADHSAPSHLNNRLKPTP